MSSPSTPRSERGHGAQSVALACAAGAALLLAACNIVNPIIYFAEGPPKQPARYLLPDAKVVVVVDDPENRLSRVSLRARLGDQIAETLIKEEVIPSAVSARDAIAWMRKHDRPGSMASLEEVGKAVGADVVIGVNVLEYTMRQDGVQPRPFAVCEVRGLDLRDHRVLFPEGAGWEPVETTLKEVSPDLYQTNVGRREVEDIAVDALAEKVAWLFYEHEIVPLGKGVRGQARR